PNQGTRSGSGHILSSGDAMYLSFALFETLDSTGKVESFLVFPTDAPTVLVDRLRDVRGMSDDRQVDLGGLRFYTDDDGLKIRRLVARYGPPAFERLDDRIRLEIEHVALPIADDTTGYYTLLLPRGFYGAVQSSLPADLHWLTDARRLLMSIQLYDQQRYRPVKSVWVHGMLSKGAEPDPAVPRIKSSEVYVNWSSGPHHNTVRGFIRAANASLSDTAPSVFICHSHRDKPFARKLAVALAAGGFKVWIDEAEIGIGESLIDKIESGIIQSTHLVAILSNESVSSRWCREELKLAITRQIGGKDITVLPLVLEDCELPGFLQEKKYADFRNARRFDESVRELSTALLV
ncbi:MAG TPA: toll/interleukin-1 receptor domain-containing protein, partial [Thermoanaerobaculia bacterium]|nr:toll/interleukin-1 receptor domain-containing protein [Thermoanaerobaculia bacterium]